MSTYRIPFNKATLVGKELGYIQDAINRGHISGDGSYTKKCETSLEKELGCHAGSSDHLLHARPGNGRVPAQSCSRG